MAGKFAELYVEIGAKLDKFNRGMTDVEKATVRIGKKLEAVGKRMTMTVTLPLLALGGAAVKMSADFDKAMTESLAIMGDISPAMRAEMEKTAKQMSEESTFAASSLAESYFFLASAGMDAAQSIKALPVVAKFAQAGAFDLATATDLLTDAQTALGLSSKDATENQKNLIRVADVLVKANTLANASVLQFSESLTNRAAAALVNVNKSMEEGVATLAAFADKGVKGQVAGMRLAMMLNALDIAARKNKKAWEENEIALFDAQGEMRSIGDIIGSLESALGGLTTEQRSATLAQLGFNIRTKASILTLMGSSEKIKQWEKDLKSAGGTMETVAKKQLEAFSNQMKLFRNELVNVGIQIGDILIPIIKEFVEDHIKPAVRWFSGLSESSKIMTIKFAGLAAATGPLLYVFAKVLVILPKLRMAFALMTGPIGIMIAAATTLGIVLGKVIDGYKAKQDAEMDAMVEAAKGHREFWAFRKKLIEDEIVTVEEWKVIYEKHGKNYQRVMRAIATLPEYKHIRDKWEELKKAQDEAKESGKELASTLEDEIAKALGEVGEKQKTWLDYLKDLGLMTLQEKQDRVIELTGYLDKIHQAYRDGKLAIDDYRKAVSLTNAEILALSTTIIDSALPAARDMSGVLEQAAPTFESAEAYIARYKEAIKEMTIAQQEFAAVALGEFVAMEASLKGFVDAIMKTFEKWAIGQIIPKIMAALPFPANLLATGGAILAIKALFAGLESLETGGLIPRPMPVMAGHGPRGEIIAQPSMLAKIITQEMPKQARPGAPDMRLQKIIIQNKIIIGEQIFYKESVKSVNKAGELGDLIIPNKVVV